MNNALIISIFLLVSIFECRSQTIDYKELIVTSEGKNKIVKWKSAVSGTKYKRQIKIGTWRYFDDFGTLLVEENYIVNNKTSLKDGYTHFYNEDGTLIKSEFYAQGHISSTTLFFPFDIIWNSHRYLSVEDNNGYLYQNTYDQDGNHISTTYASTYSLPSRLAGETSPYHLRLESYLGDSSLLIPTVPIEDHLNLVSNPGFESSKLKHSIKSIDNKSVDDWFVASKSPDYYRDPNVARTGSGAMGFRVYSFTHHIEYLGNKLQKPLKEGEEYCMTMYVKLSRNSRIVSNILGAYLSKDKWQYTLNTPLPEPQFLIQNTWLVYKSDWMRLTCTFQAKGGEQYLHIGSFTPIEGFQLTPTDSRSNECYYYIDDVSITANKTNECRCNSTRDSLLSLPWRQKKVDTTVQIGQKWVLENVYFDIDKSELLDSSKATLDELFTFLNENPDVRIEISGHTSITGEYNHNLALSKQRANAVVSYLVDQGIAELRLEYTGYGPDLPIATNETEEGRKLNRRVEVKIIR